MVSLSLQNPFSLAARLVDSGAILTLPGVPLIREVAVEIEWLSDREAAFLVLGDDLSVAPRCLRFERLAMRPFGVLLERGSDTIAAITSIETAGAFEAEDYRALWRQWRATGAAAWSAFPFRSGPRESFSGAERRAIPLATSL